MTDWTNETDELELDTLSKGPAPEHAPLLGKRLEGVIPEDLKWLAYVARLAPDDRAAAFLLPEEMPGPGSQPQRIRDALETAHRRAFANPQFRIEDYEPGRIQGEMRVLLPQGREYHFHFHNELGWKATIVVSTGDEERSFPAYYRQICMNPVRLAAAMGGELDTSQVIFTPLSGAEIQRLEENSELDRLTAQAMRRLSAQYQALAGGL